MYITTCPKCHSKFQIHDEQLNIANGLVECSCCKEIFQARNSLQVFDDIIPDAKEPERQETSRSGVVRDDEFGYTNGDFGEVKESKGFFPKINLFKKSKVDTEDAIDRETRAMEKAEEKARRKEAKAKAEEEVRRERSKTYEDPYGDAGFGFNTHADEPKEVDDGTFASKEGGYGGRDSTATGKGYADTDYYDDLVGAESKPEPDPLKTGAPEAGAKKKEKSKSHRFARRDSESSGEKTHHEEAAKSEKNFRSRPEAKETKRKESESKPQVDFQPVEEENITGLGIADKSGENKGVEKKHEVGVYRENAESMEISMMDKELYARLYMQQQEVMRQREESYWTMGSIVALIVLVMQLFYIILNP